jgi:RND family efflux transporter MFP subunit
MSVTSLSAPLLAALALVACAAEARLEGSTSAPPPPPTVRTAVVNALPYAPEVRAVGRLVDPRSGELGFAVGGLLTQFTVEEGDRVRRGQVLVRLDPEPFVAQEAQAEAALEKARRDRGRLAALRADGAAPQAPVDDATTGEAMADAAVRLARFQRARTVITAPEDGVVLRRLGTAGQVVGPGQPVLVLSTGRRGERAESKESRVVRAALVDRDVVRLKVGDPARWTLDALPGTPLTGRVTWLATLPQPGTGLFEVEVTPDPTPVPLPTQRGLLVRTTLTPAPGEPRVLLPFEALTQADGEAGRVYVVDAYAVARLRPVSILAVEPRGVWVREGLAPGEQVIVAGRDSVRTDAPVRVANPTERGLP